MLVVFNKIFPNYFTSYKTFKHILLLYIVNHNSEYSSNNEINKYCTLYRDILYIIRLFDISPTIADIFSTKPTKKNSLDKLNYQRMKQFVH